jgi:DNA-binding transcriptional LysR family regulator
MQLEPGAVLPIALECDDVLMLKRAVLESDTVLAAIYAAVSEEIQRGQIVPVHMADAPTMSSKVGIVSLRGRSHSPVAQFVIERFHELAEAHARE